VLWVGGEEGREGRDCVEMWRALELLGSTGEMRTGDGAQVVKPGLLAASKILPRGLQEFTNLLTTRLVNAQWLP
jgi:hypothetical protein